MARMKETTTFTLLLMAVSSPYRAAGSIELTGLLPPASYSRLISL